MDHFPDEILTYILQNNIGVSTLGRVCQVSKTFRRICHSNEGVLCSAALYSGGLTRQYFRELFALTSADTLLFPHAWSKRFWIGGRHVLYETDAVEQALRAVGGMAGWSQRISSHSSHDTHTRWDDTRVSTPRDAPELRRWVQEEGWHRHSASARTASPLPVGYSVPRSGPVPLIDQATPPFSKTVAQQVCRMSYVPGELHRAYAYPFF